MTSDYTNAELGSVERLSQCRSEQRNFSVEQPSQCSSHSCQTHCHKRSWRTSLPYSIYPTSTFTEHPSLTLGFLMILILTVRGSYNIYLCCPDSVACAGRHLVRGFHFLLQGLYNLFLYGSRLLIISIFPLTFLLSPTCSAFYFLTHKMRIAPWFG